MPNRFWIGATQAWHNSNNWSATSGGAGGAGIPTASDDVFIDGNGYVLCWAATPFVCNNMTLMSTMTEMFLCDQGGIIHGDFEEQAGYFGPTSGGGYTVEFKGNWLKTGGSFAVGTGAGVDPTCKFSGTTKTYVLNDVAGATYQNVLISGTIDFSGTRLTVMNIAQQLEVTGTMTIDVDNRIDLAGGPLVISGTIDGKGRFLYEYESTSEMPNGGIIECSYFKVEVQDSLVTLQPRTYTRPCHFELEYTVDAQICRFTNAARHYFLGRFTIYGNNSAIHSAELDFDTSGAEIWVYDKFDIHKNAFPNGTFTLKLGNGIHVFRQSVDLTFSYTSATSHLSVDAGEGTLILWPRGRELVPIPPP